MLSHLALPANSRIGLKDLSGENTLAYLSWGSVKDKKSLRALKPKSSKEPLIPTDIWKLCFQTLMKFQRLGWSHNKKKTLKNKSIDITFDRPYGKQASPWQGCQCKAFKNKTNREVY